MCRYLSLLALLLVASFQASADTIAGRVVAISDGDTLTVLDISNTQLKIRLSGIDAPEKKQSFGAASKRSLSDLAYNKQVVVDWKKKDRYQRTVGKVLVNGIDINLEQIKRGLAWHYSKYQKEQPFEDRASYLAAQTSAKRLRLGIWKENNPIPPWEWRKRKI